MDAFRSLQMSKSGSGTMKPMVNNFRPPQPVANRLVYSHVAGSRPSPPPRPPPEPTCSATDSRVSWLLLFSSACMLFSVNKL